jgi:hypothetical protein
MIRMTREQWIAAGKSRYGADRMQWWFRCPSCGHIATPQDYRAAGAPATAVGFSCVGRWSGAASEAFSDADGPCNYAGGGLFRINPILVTDGAQEFSMFDFAEPLLERMRGAAEEPTR